MKFMEGDARNHRGKDEWGEWAWRGDTVMMIGNDYANRHVRKWELPRRRSMTISY
jgi:hypothetical protein